MILQTASTLEIDDLDLAAEEILAQIDLTGLDENNAVGLLSCYTEFLETGAARAICEKLPFPVMGCTTLASATGEQADTMMLCLSVISGEDISLSAVSIPVLGEDLAADVAASYRAAAEKLGCETKMIIAYMPYVAHMGGEVMLGSLQAVAGNVPIFGAIACDRLVGQGGAFTFFGGAASTGAMSVLLIGGEISPRFLVTSISDFMVQRQKAIITKAQGNTLEEVNDMPALAYMKSLGLATDKDITGMQAIPFILDFGDGTKPVARAMYKVLDGGAIACAGSIPQGATLSVGSIDYEDVVQTAAEAVSAALGEAKNGLLIFDCMSRSMVLGADPLAEMQKVREMIGRKIPYQICYVGGEACPVYDQDGATVNRFHNFTLIVCAL